MPIYSAIICRFMVQKPISFDHGSVRHSLFCTPIILTGEFMIHAQVTHGQRANTLSAGFALSMAASGQGVPDWTALGNHSAVVGFGGVLKNTGRGISRERVASHVRYSLLPVRTQHPPSDRRNMSGFGQRFAAGRSDRCAVHMHKIPGCPMLTFRDFSTARNFVQWAKYLFCIPFSP